MFCTGMLSVWFLQHSVPTLFSKRIRKHCIKWLFRGLLLYLLFALFCKPWFHSRAHSGCSNGLAFSRSQRSQFQIHLFPRVLLLSSFLFVGWGGVEGRWYLQGLGGSFCSLNSRPWVTSPEPCCSMSQKPLSGLLCLVILDCMAVLLLAFPVYKCNITREKAFVWKPI